jgi:hypothetical protein
MTFEEFWSTYPNVYGWTKEDVEMLWIRNSQRLTETTKPCGCDVLDEDELDLGSHW